MQVKNLSTNMRAFLSDSQAASVFSKLLDDVGSSSNPLLNHPDTISIPAAQGQFAASLEELKAKVYTSQAPTETTLDWLAERAMISSLNEKVNFLSSWLMYEFPGQTQACKSIDTCELTDMPPHVL